MKLINIIIMFVFIIISVFTLNIFAQDNMPTYLKDATITVTLKDGKVYQFSANDYKVVTRLEQATAKVEPKIVKEVESKGKIQHSVGVLYGAAKSGLKVKTQGTTVTSENVFEPVVGLEYRLSKDWYFIEAGAMQNSTFFGGMGVNF